jgi:hypothetical protein
MARGLLSKSFRLAANPKTDPQVAKEILEYFVRNPQAADSLEGIARWRLLDEVIRRRVEETHRALAWLVRQNFLSQTTVTGAEPIFSLNTGKRAEAEAFLATGELPDDD